MIFRQLLTEIVSDAFESCGYSREFGGVTVSSRPDLCQFQCNGSMSAAKVYKKAPVQIALEVVEKLSADDRFSAVSAVPPGFINLDISGGLVSDKINAMLEDSRMLLPVFDKKTIVVDYGGPNLAKPLHVGHLRPAIIGETLCRIARFMGHEVIGDIHLGDWGLQMGLVISEIRLRTPGLCYFDPEYSGSYPDSSPVTVDELNEIYPTASKRSKTDKEFATAAAAATVELQNGRRGYLALWKSIRDISVADMKKTYDILDVHFDKWLGESDADPYIPRVIKMLTDSGALYESGGAMVVDVATEEDREPVPPIIIVKSNGGDIYGTTDLGALLQRKTDWNPDEVWYVTDNRQALHFKQVFRCAEIAGFLGDTKCFHFSNGTMNGRDGKPYKTRDGGVMRLSDFIESVTGSSYEKTSQSSVEMDEEKKRTTARQTGIAAIKIGDMLNHRSKDYIFDIDRFLASDGKTGPYLQYASVRINSVLDKAFTQGAKASAVLPAESQTESELMLSLLSVSDSLLRAYNEKAPNIICEALFDIAGLFSRFYSENRIISCPDETRKGSWLSLLTLTGRMFGTLLELLGIAVPDRM
ncbi:MAG: arginine--tRNA ligase [Oscillospiraceae bacterium]|jgi:arginyl-tRNA synthetase|nr:arginine--tRNA ligase [Oscillospiraceae bacterium]